MTKEHILAMRHDKVWMDALDAWRWREAMETQRDVSRSLAVRILVSRALSEKIPGAASKLKTFADLAADGR